MTPEQMRELVKECGLDWQRGYVPLFDDDQTNRFAVLIEAAMAAERERTLNEVLRGLRSEDDTQQSRAIINSVEALKLGRTLTTQCIQVLKNKGG